MLQAIEQRITDHDDVDIRQGALTEPEVIPCLFVHGMGVEVCETIVGIVSWSYLPHLGADMEERRIVSRLAMSNAQARRLLKQLRIVLAQGGH